VLACALNAGFLAGRSLIRRGHLTANRALYAGIVIYAIVWVTATGERTSRLGSFADLQSGIAPSITQDPTFLTMLILTMLLWPGVLVVWAVRLLREDAREAVRT
jgi:hypothetical protein